MSDCNQCEFKCAACQDKDTLIKLMADDIRSSRYTASNGEVDLTREQIIEEFKAITGE